MAVAKLAMPRRPESLPEVCLNLWYFVEDSGLVYRLAGRGYALSGTDEEKLRILHALGSSGFFVAKMYQVPARYEAMLDT